MAISFNKSELWGLRFIFISTLIVAGFDITIYSNIDPPIAVDCEPFDITGKTPEQIALNSAKCANALAFRAVQVGKFEMVRARSSTSIKWCFAMATLTGYFLWRAKR